jgi:hypothetical protein
MKNCVKLTMRCCPVCGCRKVRIITEEVMKLPLPVRAQTGVLVLDMPLITIDLHDNRFEPTVLPAICNNPQCGGEEGPCEFTVVMNPQKGQYSVYVRKGPHERTLWRDNSKKEKTNG